MDITSEIVKFCFFGNEISSISGLCPMGFRDACVSFNYTHLGDYHSFYTCANNSTCLSLNNFSGYPGAVLCCFTENCNHATTVLTKSIFFHFFCYLFLTLTLIFQ
jgi:hypothetical protein